VPVVAYLFKFPKSHFSEMALTAMTLFSCC
jgi:hypothetical protein